MLFLFPLLFPFLQAADLPELSPGRIISAASRTGGKISPGEIIILYPSNAGPAALAGSQYENGRVSTKLAETRVLFNGIPAPISYSVSGEVSAVVPYGLTKQAEIAVEYQGLRSPPVVVPVAEVNPALFTLDGSGSGQAAMLNEPGCCNSPRNPAMRGAISSLYATGAGESVHRVPSGTLSFYARSSDYPVPQLPVRVTVGGVPAQILYAGAAPHAVAGLLQVNFRVPANAPAGYAIPLVLTIGEVQSPSNVTMAVRSAVPRIAIVGQEPAWFQRVLRKAGYEVVNSDPIDLAICGADRSNELRADELRELSTRNTRLKILATADAPTPEALKSADMLGAQAVLAKPFTSAALLQRVRRLLQPQPAKY